MKNLTDIIISPEELEGTEATLSRWLINIGDHILTGEPIIELETDKVSMEICAPKTGVLTSIIYKEGDKVVTNVALGQLSEKTDLDYSPTIDDIASPSLVQTGDLNDALSTLSNELNIDDLNIDDLNIDDLDIEQSNKQLLSPAVKRLIKENSLNVDTIIGSGRNGRVNRSDIMTHLKKISTATTSSDLKPFPTSTSSLRSHLIPHSNIRKSIASHMVSSLLETSPHVTSIFEMDMDNIIQHRKWHKKEFADKEVNLTFTTYFLAAMAKAVKEVPEVNAKFLPDALEVFHDVNIGVGTALGNEGLVVPVVVRVQELELFDIAKALTIQTEKARNGKLVPADMKNGTLTISNHGVSGSLIATPIIINKPQVAILGVGKMEKRVVVEEINGIDTMVIRPKCYVSLSIDHRALDAHQTNRYLSHFVKTIEGWGS